MLWEKSPTIESKNYRYLIGRSCHLKALRTTRSIFLVPLYPQLVIGTTSLYARQQAVNRTALSGDIQIRDLRNTGLMRVQTCLNGVLGAEVHLQNCRLQLLLLISVAQSEYTVPAPVRIWRTATEEKAAAYIYAAATLSTNSSGYVAPKLGEMCSGVLQGS